MTFGSKRRFVTMGSGAPFSLQTFMANQTDGFLYDFTRTDRHYQEHTGPTLAATNGSVMQVYSVAGDVEPLDHIAGIFAGRGLQFVPDPPL